MPETLFTNLDEILSLSSNITVYRKALSILLAKLDDSDSGAKDIADVLSNDTILSASVMKVANSAYYGMSGRVTSLPGAISMLGFLTIRSLGIAALLKSSSALSEGNDDHLIIAGLATALVSDEEKEQVQVATVTCAGLLIDIGKFVLKSLNNDRYNLGLQSLEGDSENENYEEKRIALERDIFGFDHCQVGGHLLRKWNFPEEICHAVEAHALEDGDSVLDSLIQRANRLLPLFKSQSEAIIGDEENPLSEVFVWAKDFVEEYSSALAS